jgi:ferritin-like metal-binding protein YciE
MHGLAIGSLIDCEHRPKVKGDPIMPDNKDSNEVLRLYSSDLLELQRHIIDMVKDQSEQEEVKRYPEVQQLVSRVQDTVGRHFNELEQGLESLGGEKSSMLKQAMGRVAGTAMGMATKVEGSEKCSKVLRNNYAALDAASLGSLMLYTTAAAFSDDRIGEISERHFNELTSLAAETRNLIPELVVKEFAEEGYAVNSGVTEEVSQKAQQVWTRHSAFS